MRPSLLQLSTTTPMNLKPALRSVWRRSGRAAQALLSFCVTFTPLSPNRCVQMALVLVCAHAVALGSALASRYPSRAVGWHRLVGAQRPWVDVDEPWLVHRWTLMLLSLSFFPLLPFLPFSSAQQGLSNQNYLLVISHREAQRDYSLNFPASKTIQEVRQPHTCLSPSPSVCLSTPAVCLSLHCVSARVLSNCSDFFWWCVNVIITC